MSPLNVTSICIRLGSSNRELSECYRLGKQFSSIHYAPISSNSDGFVWSEELGDGSLVVTRSYERKFLR